MEQKWKYFHMLVQIGFKEIDVSFPSASQTEYDFTRKLVTTPGAAPDDVWLQVLSPCRRDLIQKTVESVRGAKKATLSIYIATSEAFRSAIFGMSKQEVLDKVVSTFPAKFQSAKGPPDRRLHWIRTFHHEGRSKPSGHGVESHV